MSQIRNLFDSSRALSRPIEKVITYQNRSEEQLRAEISEYVVTDHIEQSFEDLLRKMQLAQQGGGGHEIGVWVSGFYGSGKSSFTKYLGFSLDRDMKVGGDPFVKLLQNQLGSAGTRAMFNQVSTVYDAAVLFLDLASEMLAGASMEDISTVLYLKVLQWAGYSEDLKVAELERMLEAEGKLEAFKARAKEELNGIDWIEVHNQPLVANQIAAHLATEFYPNLFKSVSDFGDLTLHVSKAENKRAEEMIDLIRRKSGKKNVIFIIDEVGQYVSAKPSLILNLDGLAKNLKQIGGGSVWIFATAQQTLTDDNPSAALNSPGLYKLKDRFPIQVHLEASDIKEICHKRLLTKSAAGEQELNQLFDLRGASLRTATQLTDAGVYQTELTKKLFVDLYPFLPAHFEILLQLLGRLAKKTGGLGLRSAIKVVQEVLIERGHSQPLADAPVGKLANTVTFYDSLRRDIQSSFPHVVEGVLRVEQRMPTDALCQQVAKSIAVLQILENLPVTVANIAALMQPEVSSPSVKDAVEAAVNTMLNDSLIPLGEKDGGLRFLTQAAVTLQRQFDLIEYRNADVRNELNGVLRNIFKPLPSARLAQVRPVTAGLRVVIGGGQSISLEGEKEPIQLLVEFVPSGSYQSVRGDREIDSMSTRERSFIYLLGRSEPEADQLALTMVRCRKFLDAHRTASDPETQEFLRIIDARLQRASGDLERKLSASLLQGSFVAHGSHEAVSGRGIDVLEASKSFLADAAAKVFDRYDEAPHQADSTLAEKFLTTPLDRITSKEDPLSLVSRAGGKPQVKSDHKAIVSMVDYLGQSGQVEGRRLLDHFSSPPFGWSKDTTRYLLAAAFLGGVIKLRIAGSDHQVKSDESLAAFASNKSFGAVGVSLREEKPDPDALLRASERLRDLSGDNIMPLEDEIAASAKKHFPLYQAAFGPLAVELRNLGLPEECSTRAEELVNDLTEVVSGDGSDAVKRFGGLDSALHADLIWARNLKKALDNGLRVRLSHLRRLRRDIESLPESGIPGQLKASANETLTEVSDILGRTSFFDEGAALAKHSDALDKQIAATVIELTAQQDKLRQDTLAAWNNASEWQDLDGEDRDWLTQEIEKLAKTVEGDASGLRDLLNHDFTLNHRLRDLGLQFKAKAAEKLAKLIAAEKQKPEPEAEAKPKAEVQAKQLFLPVSLSSAKEVEDLIQQLNDYLAAIRAGSSLRITCRIIDDMPAKSGSTYP
jgi:hypothetical protein